MKGGILSLVWGKDLRNIYSKCLVTSYSRIGHVWIFYSGIYLGWYSIVECGFLTVRKVGVDGLYFDILQWNHLG